MSLTLARIDLIRNANFINGAWAADTAARLLDGNIAYERRFGHVFLIRAAGRDGEEILAELERRLRNDDETERAETVDNLRQIALRPGELVDGIEHVHRHPDRPPLVGDRPGDRLPDPPCGVGGELEAPAVVEPLHRPHQPQVPLLDEVEEAHPATDVPASQRNDQAKVGLHQLLVGQPP